MPRHFLLEKEDRIATLTFNRPEKRNPLNEDILLELDALLCRLRDDTEVRVLIFTGSGNTFCAGADLSLTKGIIIDDPRAREAIFQEFAPRRTRLTERVLASLVHLEPITIAAVNGYAVGGGWGLVLGCDLRVAVEGAEFWFPEVDLGAPLSPSMATLLAAQVGPARAKEMMLTGRHYTTKDLLSLGMLNRVVPQDKLMPTVAELAQALAKKNPNAVLVSKASVNAASLHHAVLRPDLLLTRG